MASWDTRRPPAETSASARVPEAPHGLGVVDDRLGVVEPAAHLVRQVPRLVHRAAGHAGELRQMAAYVVPRGSKRSARRSGLNMRCGRVSLPVPAAHCQLPALLARSPSTSRSQKWVAPARQSTYRSLVRGESGDEPGAVVHPPLRGELAHAGVDDREPGPPLAPAGEALRVGAPAIAAWVEVAARRTARPLPEPTGRGGGRRRGGPRAGAGATRRRGPSARAPARARPPRPRAARPAAAPARAGAGRRRASGACRA